MLNFVFWTRHSYPLLPPAPWPLQALFIALIATAFAALFLLGPALYLHRSGQGFFAAIETSLGPVPTHLIRLCTLWFLIDWLSSLCRYFSYFLPGILNREATQLESNLVPLILLAFLAATAHEPALARFTNRIAIAILIACALRVLGNPLAPFTEPPHRDDLSFTIAPIAFIASHYATRLQTSRQILSAAALGFALPLWICLFPAALINLASASHRSGVLSAFAGTSSRAMPSLYLIFALTLFGPIRLGLDLLRTTLPRTLYWLALLAIATPTVLSSKYITVAIPATILAAGLIRPPKGTTIPILALLTSTVVGLHNIHDPEILPAYLTAFSITLVGRKLQKP